MSAYPPQDTSLLLQVLRAVRGWDQSQFAAAASVSQGTISRYESGERMKPRVLVKFAAAAGLGLPWLESYLLPVRGVYCRRCLTYCHSSQSEMPMLDFHRASCLAVALFATTAAPAVAQSSPSTFVPLSQFLASVSSAHYADLVSSPQVVVAREAEFETMRAHLLKA